MVCISGSKAVNAVGKVALFAPEREGSQLEIEAELIPVRHLLAQRFDGGVRFHGMAFRLVSVMQEGLWIFRH